eukprot:s291_g29.t1
MEEILHQLVTIRSLSAFRQFGDTRGQADAARLLSVAMIHQDRRKEADRLLKDELAIFQTSANSGSKSAEALLPKLSTWRWGKA